MKPGPSPGRVRITSAGGWVEAAVAALEAALTEASSPEDGLLRVGLSGGSTPEPVYRAWAKTGRLASGRVLILPADERWVEADHPESNHRMMREALASAKIDDHRMPFFGRREGRTLEQAARDLAEALPARFDLLVLGIGEDGHTASLFPGDTSLLPFGALPGAETAPHPRSLDELGSPWPIDPSPSGSSTLPAGPTTLAVRDAPKPPAERLTVTPTVIDAAAAVVVLARGPAKADAVQRAIRGAWDPVATPAQWARSGSWVLDPGAASGL